MTSLPIVLMRKLHLAVVPLRVVLVLTFAMLLLFQVMSLPGEFSHRASKDPGDAHLYWAMLGIAELMVVCVQVVIVCVWRLLGLVRDDRIFTQRSFAWVDGIVWSMLAGCILLFGLFCYLAAHFRDPALPLVMLLALLVGTVFALLMVVMRALLWQATALRTDMDAVI